MHFSELTNCFDLFSPARLPASSSFIPGAGSVASLVALLQVEVIFYPPEQLKHPYLPEELGMAGDPVERGPMAPQMNLSAYLADRNVDIARSISH